MEGIFGNSKDVREMSCTLCGSHDHSRSKCPWEKEMKTTFEELQQVLEIHDEQRNQAITDMGWTWDEYFDESLSRISTPVPTWFKYVHAVMNFRPFYWVGYLTRPFLKDKE